MNKKMELLAPGGDINSIKAAILAGANAVYCGLNQFNARNRATNINFKDLNGILNLAHRNNCKVFLTLNIIIVESEFAGLINLLNKLVNTRIDGIIVQDLGVFYILSKYFKSLKIHASTQCTTHNEGQIKFLKKLSINRVNLSRELNIREIKDLTLIGHKENILTEVFVHGSYCISFSGICYMSSVHGGNSGNRGRCSQPCRDRYFTTPNNKKFPLNLKDNSAYFDLKELSEAGVDSLKIEGRIKKFDYVFTVVNCWKKQLDSFYNKGQLINDNSDLYKVFNRDFSNSYLKGDINKKMFIDNPRDHSIKHLSEINNYSTSSEMEKGHLKFYEEKEKNKNDIENQIKQLSISKFPLIISISGKLGTVLKVSVETPDRLFFVLSESSLVNTGKFTIDYNLIMDKFKVFNNNEYYIKDLDIENLQKGLSISFRELTSIRKRIKYILNGSKEIITPIKIPLLNQKRPVLIKPTLSLLISSQKDLHLCNKTTADIFFQLPDSLGNKIFEFVKIFKMNKKLIPWFPSILIGKDFDPAIEFLSKLQPELIVTNNTGIAYEAYVKGIPWIAGPHLNIINSFSILCLKKKFNCFGSFISNELSKYQMKNIKCPENFELCYSIYHPILLMTSRQCLFHQVTGCEKSGIDKDCITKCHKSASITNLKNSSFFIKKTKGNYNSIYNNTNFLNTDIITDLSNTFSRFFIDLRDIKTETEIKINKFKIINLFESLIAGNVDSENEIKQMIHPTTDIQYNDGI